MIFKWVIYFFFFGCADLARLVVLGTNTQSHRHLNWYNLPAKSLVGWENIIKRAYTEKYIRERAYTENVSRFSTVVFNLFISRAAKSVSSSVQWQPCWESSSSPLPSYRPTSSSSTFRSGLHTTSPSSFVINPTASSAFPSVRFLNFFYLLKVNEIEQN